MVHSSLSSFAVVFLSVAASLLETFPYHPFNGPFLSLIFCRRLPERGSESFRDFSILSFQWSIPLSSFRLSWPVSFHFFLQGVSPPYSLIFPAIMASILPFLPPGRFPSIFSDLPSYHGQYPSISSSRAFPLHIHSGNCSEVIIFLLSPIFFSRARTIPTSS